MDTLVTPGVDGGAMKSFRSRERDWDFMEWDEKLGDGKVIIWDTVSKRVSYFRFFLDIDGKWRDCPDEEVSEYEQKHADLLQLFDSLGYDLLT